MANSSDWIAQVGGAPRAPSAWLSALGASASPAPGSTFAAMRSAQTSAGSEQDRIAQAYADGVATGRAQANADAQAERDAHRAVRLAFRSLDQQALDALASDLSETVVSLCSQVIDTRAIDYDALAERCQAAAARIGGAARHCKLRLHPADIPTLAVDELHGIEILPDPALERGELVLEGPDGAARDGPGEWRRAIAAALLA